MAWALPGAVVGIFLGWLLAASVPVWAVEAAVGAIAIIFGVNQLAARRGAGVSLKKPQPDAVGLFWGGVSGFTSQIALAGGPPFQIWALSRKLSRDMFVGTNALFFAASNWLKVPAFFALGQFTTRNAVLTGDLAAACDCQHICRRRAGPADFARTFHRRDQPADASGGR